jgi:glycosyltransferase A (GT-A) superfamily protein (DUF2064 family)
MVPPNAICVVAKCPIPGKSKTRLSSGLTDDGCARMARAMLCDVLAGLHGAQSLSSVMKFLYYAPADDDGRRRMKWILDDLGIPYRYCAGGTTSQVQHQPQKNDQEGDTWYLCPMPDASRGNLRSSDLGTKLAGMLEHTRSVVKHDFGDNKREVSSPAVAFLGMDSPELPIEEIAYALRLASGQIAESSNGGRSAYINPSHDGGYGMLCLPPHAPSSVFEGVRWSDPLTAASQMKALTDAGIAIVVGSLMQDIDEMEDLIGLAERLRLVRGHGDSGDDESGNNLDGNSGDDAIGSKLDGDKLLKPPPGRGIKATRTDDNMCQYSWESIQHLKIKCEISTLLGVK